MLRTALLLALGLLTLPLSATAADDDALGAITSPEPVKIIFDTDMGNDVDDALALGILHELQSRRLVELLAVTITKSHPLAAEYVDAVNTFYGRPDIPVGLVQDGVTPQQGRFVGLAAVKDDGKLRYPHDLNGNSAPDAVNVLRKTLAAQPDGSVIIAQVGFSTNLARLLDSEGDNVSPLSGRQLVAQKVKLLSIMAGYFEMFPGRKPFAEYNVDQDVLSARKLVAEWPTEIVWSGWEVGRSIEYPAVSILKDYGITPHHPLAEAYQLYKAAPHNRPTWDLTSVLYAVFPERGYFTLSPAGEVTIDERGFSTFAGSDNGRHRYLKVTPEQIIRVKEAFVWLSSAPPTGLRKP